MCTKRGTRLYISVASTKEPEEREYSRSCIQERVCIWSAEKDLDSVELETMWWTSGACLHMVCKEDLHSAELKTMRILRNPTTVMTANDEVETREEATIYVKEQDLFVTVKLLEETTAVLALGKLCEDHGFTYHCISGQKTTSEQKW